MASKGLRRRGTALSCCAGALLLIALAGRRAASDVAPSGTDAPPPAYELTALPAGVDSLTSLSAASHAIAACAPTCRGIVYTWTPRMPLSRAGIPHIVAAAAALDVPVTLVSTEELLDYAAGRHPEAAAGLLLADAMLAAGALAHAPATVAYAGHDLVGPAVLGYKRADAYESFMRERLGTRQAGSANASAQKPIQPSALLASTTQAPADFDAVGLPGAYFRWIPGTRQVAYESDRTIYFLDLDDGENRVAPGWIDFVPTPDGRFFVTPGPDDEGLTFYDARDVFAATERNRSMSVEGIFVDNRMRDQYPSVGILESSDVYTRYRILTSWFRGLLYRDYEVRVSPSGAAIVRPLGEPTVPCAALSLSTPIMSQDGQEVAARDERTGTTKMFLMLDAGRCEEVLDLGVPTSKVAWQADGQRLTFSVPQRARGAAAGPGIFVLDRASRAVTPVPGSEGASRLAFPDFVGDDAVVFLIPATDDSPQSVFRLVEGL